jgi:hypothetical protein
MCNDNDNDIIEKIMEYSRIQKDKHKIKYSAFNKFYDVNKEAFKDIENEDQVMI